MCGSFRNVTPDPEGDLESDWRVNIPHAVVEARRPFGRPTRPTLFARRTRPPLALGWSVNLCTMDDGSAVRRVQNESVARLTGVGLGKRWEGDWRSLRTRRP